MKAMILAAGFGTRLGAITERTPKCLVEAGGKSMLEHVVDRLRAVGISTVVINLHHLAEQVRSFVAARNGFGLDVIFSYEPEILGTGGALRKAAQFFVGDDVLVHNADIYSDIALDGLILAHQNTNATATLAVMERPNSRPLLFDSANNLVGWENVAKGTGERIREGDVTRLAFSGIHVISSRLIPYIERGGEGAFSVITAYLDAARSGERILAHRVDSSLWIDVGTPDKLEQLRQRLGGATADSRH